MATKKKPARGKKAAEGSTTDKDPQQGGGAAAPEALRQALEQAQVVLRKLPLVGPVFWLHVHSPLHKYTFVADFEWRVLPALVNEQCKLYMKGEAPIAYVSWAFVDEKVDRRLSSGQHRLAPTEWACGDRLWLIDLVAPFGGAEDIIRDVRENLFPTRSIRYLVPDFKRRGIRPVIWKPVRPPEPEMRH